MCRHWLIRRINILDMRKNMHFLIYTVYVPMASVTFYLYRGIVMCLIATAIATGESCGIIFFQLFQKKHVTFGIIVSLTSNIVCWHLIATILKV